MRYLTRRCSGLKWSHNTLSTSPSNFHVRTADWGGSETNTRQQGFISWRGHTYFHQTTPFSIRIARHESRSEEVRHTSRNADSACPFALTPEGMLSQQFVTHVAPPLRADSSFRTARNHTPLMRYTINNYSRDTLHMYPALSGGGGGGSEETQNSGKLLLEVGNPEVSLLLLETMDGTCVCRSLWTYL